MKKSIFKENKKKYTFSDYFEMNNPTEEIVGEFGYSYAMEVITLPKSTNYNKDIIKNLQDIFYSRFKFFSVKKLEPRIEVQVFFQKT